MIVKDGRMKEKRRNQIPNLSKKSFETVLNMVPLCTVECVIKTSKGVLLTKRNIKPFKGYWHIPGGFVWYNEKLESAVKRVAKKETNMDVRIEKYLGYYDEIDVDPRGHLIGHIFLLKPVSGRFKRNRESAEAKFFKAIPKKIPPHHAEILKMVGLK